MKYAFVARERAHYPLVTLCRLLNVSVSGFYADQSRKATPRPVPDTPVRQALREAHKDSRGTYGRCRLVPEMHDRGFPLGEKQIRRLMREEGLRGRSKGPAKPRTTHSAHSRSLAPNVLDRRFEVSSDTPAWVSDITCIPVHGGWMYLAVVLSVQTRQVLGYSLAARMTDTLVMQAFENAWSRFPVGPGVIFHSDRGGQYASQAFRSRLQGLGFVLSMSRRANCWDNAVAESFFSTLKNEEVPRSYPTQADASRGVNHYILGFYNPKRRHSSLGYLSPNDYAQKLKAA